MTVPGQKMDKAMTVFAITRRLGAMSLLLLGLAGCGYADMEPAAADSSAHRGSTPGQKADIGSLTYRAVDLMLAEAVNVPAGTPIVVATVSSVDDLNAAAPIGNMVSDLVRSRLVQSGATVSDMRLRSTVAFNRNNGEFVLSRQPGSLVRPPKTAVVVTGTYAAGYNRVYVSLKMIAAADGRIIAGADYSVPRGGEVEGLLRLKVAGQY